MLHKSTFFFSCVLNLKPLKSCVSSFPSRDCLAPPPHFISRAFLGPGLSCLLNAREAKINIKRKKTFFSSTVLLCFLPDSVVSQSNILVCAFPKWIFGFNRGTLKIHFAELFSFKLFSLLLSSCRLFRRFLLFLLSDPLTATTKLETLSEFFNLSREDLFFFRRIFNIFFTSNFFLPSSIGVINREERRNENSFSL